MEPWIILIIVLGSLLIFLFSGLPVAFAFLLINLIGTFIWMGGMGSMLLPVESILRNIGSFTLVAVPLFILMGSILFNTGIAKFMIDGMGKWIGRIPGSLSILAVGSGTVFAMMSGSSMSSVAILGSTLVPEMTERGYSKEMSIGPILGAGGLAMIIPPSILAILLATIAKISVGKLLIGGIVPGIILALLYALYILIRASIQRNVAPAFVPPNITWKERAKSLIIIIPPSLIILFVLGFIFLGITTPSEAAATGVLGALILAVCYRKLNWESMKKSISETLMVTGMVFLIIMGSTTFSNILAYTGSTSALIKLAVGLTVHPILVIILMQLVLIFLGTFMDGLSMMMITIPIYMPVINTLGYDPIWFGILVLINVEMGLISPPFGLSLYIMKGIVPTASTKDIILAAIPFFMCGILLIGILLIFPNIVLWLPGLMS